MKSGMCRLVSMVAIGLMVMGVLVTPGKASEKKEITLSYANFPPAVTFPCVQMERWKEEVEKRTDGQIKVQTYPGSTLLNPKNMYDGVVSGLADIGCFAMSYLPGRFPVSEAVDMPIGFDSAKVASLTLFDLIEEMQPEEFQDVKIVTMFTCPPCNFMTSQPVKKLEDLEGRELRCSGTAVDIIKRLEGVPVALPMSDTPDAIQKGVVSGIVSSLEVLKDMNFAAYCPYATRANLYVVTFAVVMNQEKWNSLPEDVKKVIDDLRREQALWTGKYVDNHVDKAIKWAKEEYDLEVFELTEEEMATIDKELRPMIDEYIKRANGAGLPGVQIMNTVMRLKEEHSKKY